jgi:hypothetical protein
MLLHPVTGQWRIMAEKIFEKFFANYAFDRVFEAWNWIFPALQINRSGRFWAWLNFFSFWGLTRVLTLCYLIGAGVLTLS